MQSKTTDAAPVIDLSGLTVGEISACLLTQLRDNNKVYAREGRLCRVTQYGVEDLNIHSLALALGDAHYHHGKSRRLQDWMLKAVLEDENCGEYVQHLDAVSRVPILEPDGSVQHIEGYSYRTRRYHIIDDTLVALYETRPPNRAQAEDALKCLLALIEDTPFEDQERGRSCWVAYVLAIFSRHLYSRSPLFLFDGNEPGGGKTILMTMGGAIHSGKWGPVNNLPSSEEEFEKRIPQFFNRSEPFVLFDEVRHLNGAGLKSVLTSEMMQGRVLGTNKLFHVKNTKVLAATGNNVGLEGDMRRRTIRIGVMKPPTQVQYRIRDIESHVLDNRNDLFSAAITILQWALTTKEARPDIPVFPSFEEFSRLVREPLVLLGMPDPYIANDESVHTDADDTKEAVADFVDALFALGTEFKGSDIAEYLNDQSEPLWAYRGLFWAKSSAPLDSRTVGKVLGQHLNKHLPNGKILKRRSLHGYSVYTLA